MAAAVYESEGWAIDINAVREQLRLLGHDVSDDVIVQFIKDVYIPQRAAAQGATQTAPLPPSAPPAPGTAPAARPRAATSASLALAAAVESDDNVVLSTDDDAFDAPRSSFDQLRHSSSGRRANKVVPPIDARGDSASDWDDAFGLKSLKISETEPSRVQQDKAAGSGAGPAYQGATGVAAAGVGLEASSQRPLLPSAAAHPAAASTLHSSTTPPHTLPDTVSPRDTLHYTTTSTLPPAPAQPLGPHGDQPKPATQAAHTAVPPRRQTPLSAILAGASVSAGASREHAGREHASREHAGNQGTTHETHNTYSFLPRTQPARHVAAPILPASRPTSSAPRASDWTADLHDAMPGRTQPGSVPAQPPAAAQPVRARTAALPVQRVTHPYSFLADTSWVEPPAAHATAYPRHASPLRDLPEAVRDTARGPRDSSTEGSLSSFSTRSATSSVRSSVSGKKKVDRVNRYHELAAGWEKDRFLKRNTAKPKQAFNFHTYFAALHESEAHQQQQRKKAVRAQTQKALAPAATYQVPTEKRRDSLRWEVRMQMRRVAESADL